jgi:DNA polymerase-3 subunit beta
METIGSDSHNHEDNNVKITLSQSDLLPATTTLQSIAATKNNFPILANVLVDTSDGTIQMIATDSEVAVRLKVPGTVHETGATTIPARKLADLTRQLPAGEEIRIEATANEQIQLTCGRSAFRMIGLPAEDYPKVSLPADGGFTVDAPIVRAMLAKTQFAASTEETRYFLNGVYLHLSTEWMRFVATDSRRLAMMSHPAEGLVKKEMGVILPIKAVDEILRTFDGDEELRIAFHDNLIVFGTDNATLTSRLIDGEYPAYPQIVGQVKDNPIVLTANREAFLTTLARVSLFANPKTLGIRLEGKEGVLRVSTSSQDFGEAKDELDVDLTAPIHVAFNVKFLTEALQAVDTENVRIFLKDAVTAGVVRPDDETDYLCLIMPMRMD